MRVLQNKTMRGSVCALLVCAMLRQYMQPGSQPTQGEWCLSRDDKTHRITLKYTDGRGVISGLRRISRPGIRTYQSSEKLPRVNNGLGIAIISTSKGLMTDKQARKENIGGEVLCTVW